MISKVAIATTNFSYKDMRGSEEINRLIAFGLSSQFDVTVLSPSNKLDKRDIDYINSLPFRVVYFKTHPIISSIMKIAAGGLKRIIKLFGKEPQYFRFYSFVRMLSHGNFLTPSLYRHLLNNHYDVILSSIIDTYPAFSALKASIKMKTPFVFIPFYHYNSNLTKGDALLQYAIKHAAAIIASTPKERLALIRFGAKTSKTFVVYPSFYSKSITRLGVSRANLIKKLGLENKFIILTHPWCGKGALVVLRAVNELANNGENVALITIGEPDNLYLKEKENLLKTNHKLKVVDLGWVTGAIKWQAFAICDVFAMPSLNDAFGISYLNAWAFSKPVIGAAGSQIEDVITQGKDGFLVKPGDQSKLSAYISELNKNKWLAKKLGKSGKSKLKNKFNVKNAINGYLKITKDVVKNLGKTKI